MKSKLSFVTLISYDYKYSLDAIRSYYEIADEIFLGLDSERLTWSQQPFAIDMANWEAELRLLDRDRKIQIVEGCFHRDRRPMINETYERASLSGICREGNWIVQIDADEVLLNANEFQSWISPLGESACVLARWISVFKVFKEGALVVHPANEWTPVATRLRGKYQYARFTEESTMQSPLELLHFSWGRTPDELRQKLQNWGHAQDFDTAAFFQFWQSVSLKNYTQCSNFHPIKPDIWPGLRLLDLKSIAGGLISMRSLGH